MQRNMFNKIQFNSSNNVVVFIKYFLRKWILGDKEEKEDLSKSIF